MSSSREAVSKLITTKLIRRIIDGVYLVGSRLPTEREIAEEFRALPAMWSGRR